MKNKDRIKELINTLLDQMYHAGVADGIEQAIKIVKTNKKEEVKKHE